MKKKTALSILIEVPEGYRRVVKGEKSRGSDLLAELTGNSVVFSRLGVEGLWLPHGDRDFLIRRLTPKEGGVPRGWQKLWTTVLLEPGDMSRRRGTSNLYRLSNAAMGGLRVQSLTHEYIRRKSLCKSS